MKKILIVGIIALMVIGCVLVAGCTMNLGNGDSGHQSAVPVTILADYRDSGCSGVIQLPTYTSIDDSSIISFYNNLFLSDNTDNNDLSHSACECVIKPSTINGEDVLIWGRNVDMYLSDYPAFVFEVNSPDRYRSINLGYWWAIPDLGTFDEIAETSTIGKDAYDVLVYIPTDVMNEKGLVLEGDLRKSDGRISCSGTNPTTGITINFQNILRVLGDRCANIDEVLNLLDYLNIYANEEADSAQAISMMDATGRYGVLEFIDNKPVWHESYPCQTNFWIDKEAFSRSDLNEGIGRWEVLMDAYDNLKTEDDVAKVLEKTWYYQIGTEYTDDIPFDVSSEFISDSPQTLIYIIEDMATRYNISISEEDRNTMQRINASFQKDNQPYWTNSYLSDSNHKDDFNTLYNIMIKIRNQVPFFERPYAKVNDLTVISYTVNNKDLVYNVRFLEQDDVFHFGIST